ncbi:MAG: ABC transporter permease [Deltaproteobacteria bacterium]|nr:ABC transporter permease [Deltaproteobacteria bacterium]
MGGLAYWGVLFVLSVRNIFTHKVKSLIVGSLMFFGTALVVTGTALLDSVEDSMSKSITSSLAGHLQVYSAKSKDELALFGGMMMASEDIGRIGDFERVKEVASKVPNVKAVVPMGIDIATVMGGNETDRLATSLREAVAAKDARRIELLERQLRQLADGLRKELTAKLEISATPEEIKKDLALIDRLDSDQFWDELERDPEPAVTFIETKIAPLSVDGLMIYLRYVGTDLDSFRKEFERFEIVKGQVVPPHQRGFLFADKFYEDQVKHKVARDLDKIHRQVTEEGKKIAEDPLLGTLVAQNARQYRRITFQLEPDNAAKLRTELAKMLPEIKNGDQEPDLDRLMQAFLTVNDHNVKDRYRFFYDVIAPMIELYQVRVGEMMTIRAYTRSGYLKAANVKVYGTFNFRGLEKSDLAAAANLLDIVTFRDLYGLMSDAKRAELAEIKASVGASEIGRQNAEDALFGSGAAPIEAEAEAGGAFDEFAGATLATEVQKTEDLVNQVFDQQTVDRGVALNSALVLSDPSRLEETRLAVEQALSGAGLEMKVVDWQKASGLVGQFIIVLRLVLYIAIGIIFLVTLVIINNSMVMATMERTTEIGTLRAMGAQRNTVMVMFLFETIVLGMIAGSLGALGGASFVTWLGHVGIAAGTQDVLIFLFGGPRLFPSFGPDNLLVGLIVIFVVSLISTLYPARLATRVAPVVAMQARE